MKVVHLSTTDFGGAYKAAERISACMKSVGVDSKVLVRTKTRIDTDGIEVINTPLKKFISKTKNVGNLLLSEGNIISDYFGTDISKNQYVKDADVIFLHWVNSFISYRDVEKLIKLNKKIIWVMHDMWLFTGGCHCDQYCGRYQFDCGYCPMLKKEKDNDISRKNFSRKQKMLQNGNIILIGPSEWIVSCAKNSRITNRKRIERIPNPIDIQMFRPIEKDMLFEKYNIDNKKKVILYGAMNAVGDKNKGYIFLKNAVEKIDKTKYQLLIFGNKAVDTEMEKNIQTIFLGYIHEEKTLVDLYNIADVFVCPSQQENYPYAVLEAQACNTPVVAFRIGGIPDIISHKETGYLCTYGNVEEMVEGIEFCSNLKHEICGKVNRINSYAAIGNQYKKLACEYINS